MDNPYNPLITIITITYNAQDHLQATMQSVNNQAFRNFEHLIIDGASTDHTLDIAKSHSLANTRIISEPDNGLYDAMNKGLRQAKGKYVIFLNAGDTFHNEDILGKYAFEVEKNSDIISGDTVVVDSQRNFIKPRHLSVPQQLTFQSFAKGMLICHQAFMVKKSLAPEFNTDYKFSADYDWTVRCIQNTDPSKCINLNCITIDYLSDGLTDKNKFKSLKERFKIMMIHYGLFSTIINHVSFIFRAVKRKSI